MMFPPSSISLSDVDDMFLDGMTVIKCCGLTELIWDGDDDDF